MFFRFLFVDDLLFNLFRIALWLIVVGKELVPFSFRVCCFYFSAVLIVGITFPFGVWAGWYSIVSCFIIYLEDMGVENLCLFGQWQ